MEKSTNSIKDFRKYFREISVVVIGVAITLTASYYLGNRNEKRDIALYLNAIKLELEENNKILYEAIEELQPSLRYTDYLKSHDKKLLNKDSIKIFQYAFYSFAGHSLKTNAFEMFKSSGVMRLLDDKELLLSLWDVYGSFKSVEETFDTLFPIKWEDVKKEMSLLLDGKEIKAPMYNYFYTGMPYQLLQPCEKALRKSNETLSKLKEIKALKQFETSDVKTEEDFGKFLGIYTSGQTDIIITITEENNRLFAQAKDQPNMALKMIGKNIFELIQGDAIFEFNPADSAMILKQSGKSFIFEKKCFIEK